MPNRSLNNRKKPGPDHANHCLDFIQSSCANRGNSTQLSGLEGSRKGSSNLPIYFSSALTAAGNSKRESESGSYVKDVMVRVRIRSPLRFTSFVGVSRLP